MNLYLINARKFIKPDGGGKGSDEDYDDDLALFSSFFFLMGIRTRSFVSAPFFFLARRLLVGIKDDCMNYEWITFSLIACIKSNRNGFILYTY